MSLQTNTVQSFRLKPLNLMFSNSDSKYGDGTSEQDVLLQTYWGLIDKMSNPFTIDIIRKFEMVPFNTPIICPFDIINMNISEDDNMGTMSTLGKMTEPTEGMDWEIAEEYDDCVRLVYNDTYAKSYTISMLHENLTAGWLYENIYRPAGAVRIFVEPIPEDKWDSKIRSHSTVAKTFSSAFNMDMTANITEMRSLVLNNKLGKLYFVKIVPIVFGNTREELEKNAKQFEIDTKNIPQIYTNKYVQSNLLNGTMAQRILLHTSAFNCILPFITSELYEEGGILLGQNLVTGNPVKWNMSERISRNTVLAATSGAGKSVTAKLIVHSFEKMYPNSFIFGIDPEHEYDTLGKNMGFEYIDYSFGKNMGLDLFKMLPDSFLAAETLCEALNVPPLDRIAPNNAAGQMMSMDMKDRSFFKFYDLVDKLGNKNVLKYFDTLVNPPYSDFFKGSPPKSLKIILSLKNLGSAGGTVHKLISQISLAYAMGRALSMPKLQQKLFILDEVWMLLQHGSLGDYIQNLSRRGRKYNINMMLITQNIEDMTNNEAAKNVLVNSDTVIFLRQSSATIDALRRHFPQLSEFTLSTMLKLQVGQALIKYGNDIVPTKIIADKQQIEMYTPK